MPRRLAVPTEHMSQEAAPSMLSFAFMYFVSAERTHARSAGKESTAETPPNTERAETIAAGSRLRRTDRHCSSGGRQACAALTRESDPSVGGRSGGDLLWASDLRDPGELRLGCRHLGELGEHRRDLPSPSWSAREGEPEKRREGGEERPRRPPETARREQGRGWQRSSVPWPGAPRSRRRSACAARSR